ncbi:MAG: serine/threonine-protein phosphatase, partial [Cellulomonadaceae bacterium]|nr:serine/threonine-protein phosphatase [Cellulomonadaceae bacterium]
LAAVAAAGTWGYGWTQQQYYVGAADGQIAVFRGIPQSVGPIVLSRPVEVSDTLVADLPSFFQDRLDQTISVDSLEAARAKVAEFELEADGSS